MGFSIRRLNGYGVPSHTFGEKLRGANDTDLPPARLKRLLLLKERENMKDALPRQLARQAGVTALNNPSTTSAKHLGIGNANAKSEQHVAKEGNTESQSAVVCARELSSLSLSISTKSGNKSSSVSKSSSLLLPSEMNPDGRTSSLLSSKKKGASVLSANKKSDIDLSEAGAQGGQGGEGIAEKSRDEERQRKESAYWRKVADDAAEALKRETCEKLQQKRIIQKDLRAFLDGQQEEQKKKTQQRKHEEMQFHEERVRELEEHWKKEEEKKRKKRQEFEHTQEVWDTQKENENLERDAQKKHEAEMHETFTTHIREDGEASKEKDRRKKNLEHKNMLASYNTQKDEKARWQQFLVKNAGSTQADLENV